MRVASWFQTSPQSTTSSWKHNSCPIKYFQPKFESRGESCIQTWVSHPSHFTYPHFSQNDFLFFYKLRYSKEKWFGKCNVLFVSYKDGAGDLLSGGCALWVVFAAVEKGVSLMCPHILFPLSFRLLVEDTKWHCESLERLLGKRLRWLLRNNKIFKKTP